jgi:hypothetical protein
MDSHRIGFGWTRHALLIAGFTLIAIPSVQAFEVTAEQEQACEPDAFRLCSSEIPDASRVAACMQANEASLSPQCHAVFQNENADDQSAPVSHQHRVHRILSDYAHD